MTLNRLRQNEPVVPQQSLRDPHRHLAQYNHADLGLIEDDNTEDMRRAPAATEALRNQDHPNTQMKGQS